MKKLFMFGAAILLASGVHAASVDFANEANTNGERGLADGTSITIDSIAVTLSAGGGSAYLDSASSGRDGGLGVCSVLDLQSQCNPSSDDNTSVGESLFLSLDDGTTSVSDFLFRDANHYSLAGSEGLIDFMIDGSAWFTTTFANFMADTVGFDMASLGLRYNNTQFYLSSFMTGGAGGGGQPSPVPLPAGALLLLGGLGLLGATKARKRKS